MHWIAQLKNTTTSINTVHYSYTVATDLCWKKWENITPFEQEAITSALAARRIITTHIPRDEIVAIYLKGSFIRREMTPTSDVDTLTILRHSRYLPVLKKMEQHHKSLYHPPIGFSGYSVWELRYNKRSRWGTTVRASPGRIVYHLPHYRLLYGQPVDTNNLFHIPPLQHLNGMINVFRSVFLKQYEMNQFSFSVLIKQVFWLVESELRFTSQKTPYHWGQLTALITDKNHIIHDALRLRNNPTTDTDDREHFISKLQQYLTSLEKLIKMNQDNN